MPEARPLRAIRPKWRFFDAPTVRYGAWDDPPKKRKQIQSAATGKTLSSHRIIAPARVLAIEVFARSWQQATSSGGIAIEISRIRPRALVGDL